MAQFDVYDNSNPKIKKIYPYLLDIQADLLNHLSTRIVIPLMESSHIKHSIKHLMPHFMVENISVTLLTAGMSAINNSALTKKIGSLKDKRNDIMAAVDFLFTGI